MSEAETPDTTPARAVPYAALEQINAPLIDALGDLDGLIDLLVMIEESSAKPDISNIALRPIIAAIRRAAGHVGASMDVLDQFDLEAR